MTNYVVDASVGIKWCMPARERLTLEAEDLLAAYLRQEVRLAVPDLFWVEVGNVLWKSVRTGRILRAAADTAYEFMLDLGLAVVPSQNLVRDALPIALDQTRTVYESLYIALAVQSKSQLITADERLANAVSAYLPVKWLGAY